MQHDETLPGSRGCPLAYSLARIYIAETFPRSEYSVALIAVHGRGFEGNNLRHIAIPVPLVPLQ